MSKNNFAIIMAGGIGSRFWPTSTPDFPKQFHDMTGTGQSLLQQTFHRLENTIPPEQIFIVTHASYQAIILDQLEGKISSDQIICEPEQRNTAPCILLASLKIKKINSKARIVVTPSDHLILDEELFTEDINLALKATDEKNLITFGIQPDHPATGFGYIAVDKVSDARFLPVLEFTEKPDIVTAKKLIAAENYFWNSGIFVWSVQAVLSGFKSHAPNLYALFNQGFDQLNTADEGSFIAKNYSLAEKISIDYAVMEKSKNILLSPARFDWNDLGSWKSIYDFHRKDKDGNAVIHTDLYHENASRNLVKTNPNKKVVIAGLDNFIVVDTQDFLMLCPMDKNQEVKEISSKANKKFNRGKT